MDYLALIPLLWILTNLIFETRQLHWGYYSYRSYVRLSKKKDSGDEGKKRYLEFAKPFRKDYLKFIINHYGVALFIVVSVLVIFCL